MGQKDGWAVCYVVLDGIFDRLPTLNEVVTLPVLKRNRFSFAGQPAVSCAPPDFSDELRELCYLGRTALTPNDHKLFASCGSFANWRWASFDAEFEWRWRHDRNALIAEWMLSEEEDKKQRIELQKRREARLRNLTWENLLNELPLAVWDMNPNYPPRRFVLATRERLHAAVRDLRKLGPKPKKAAVRAVVKNLVEWFNHTNREFGNVIETEERDNICEALEELVSVAGHPKLSDEIDEWRDW
jgi:hypothetical protein